MDNAAAPMPHPLAPEDQARADFYALLARLYAAPPDAALLRAIAGAPPLEAVAEAGVDGADGHGDDAPGALPAAWDDLRAASAALDPEAAADEYTDLFVGVGKSEVNLHASHWLTGHMMDRPLVEVRAALAELGLAQRAGSPLVEDHLAALFEAMRLLIAGERERPPVGLPVQRAFFERHIEPWVFLCCDAICDCLVANFYRRVAQFTERYVALERDSFAID